MNCKKGEHKINEMQLKQFLSKIYSTSNPHLKKKDLNYSFNLKKCKKRANKSYNKQKKETNEKTQQKSMEYKTHKTEKSVKANFLLRRSIHRHISS